MIFKDYTSAFSEFRKGIKTVPGYRQGVQSLGINADDFESVYQYEISRLDRKRDFISIARLQAELFWHRQKRPYFNVYPVIERKLLELDGEIDCSELTLPFKSIEIRTKNKTFLLAVSSRCFIFVVELGNGYQEFVVNREEKLQSVAEAPLEKIPESNWPAASGRGTSDEQRYECIWLAAGICMLARDKSIVVPVVLNQHKKENMTPEEIADYSDKAINRTGRVGFDVGKDIERMKATVHYRNGCFSKYYIGKDHEQYPPNAESSKVPIIKWRCGSIVNKANIPEVPTGFKDTVQE